MLSILILTKNEEVNIAGCLRSVAWSDDIVVYDSFSSDRTVAISKEFGARVVQRGFDDWSSHQNWGIQHITFKHPWVLYLDADEVCDEELTKELHESVDDERNESAFRIRRKDYFMGKWLRRSQFYPTWIVRVFRPERIRYERKVNPVAIVDGNIGDLRGHLIHHPFSHGISHWFERHNRYSTFEAEDLLRERNSRLDWPGLLSSDSNRRRGALKQLSYRVPGRPPLTFTYLYFIRMGFLDGVPGLYYSAMRAAYELMIDAKVRESLWRAKGSKKSESVPTSAGGKFAAGNNV
jgi:glycosyltransferase involved in cell wall biosynthesis